MKYKNTVNGIFLDRPNRFEAHVMIDDHVETVHVKNTGRCKELLLPGVRVVLEKAMNPGRKTGYDLIAVFKENLGWVNIDSQAPNQVVSEWLQTDNDIFTGLSLIKPEYKFGDSRVDFYLEKQEQKILMEVKGCTLEINGQGYFPDAPTQRGVKHLRELAGAISQGFECYIAFVIAMNGITSVKPNMNIHPEFGNALNEAKIAGVNVLYLCCDVTPDELRIIKAIRSII